MDDNTIEGYESPRYFVPLQLSDLLDVVGPDGQPVSEPPKKLCKTCRQSFIPFPSKAGTVSVFCIKCMNAYRASKANSHTDIRVEVTNPLEYERQLSALKQRSTNTGFKVEKTFANGTTDEGFTWCILYKGNGPASASVAMPVPAAPKVVSTSTLSTVSAEDPVAALFKPAARLAPTPVAAPAPVAAGRAGCAFDPYCNRGDCPHAHPSRGDQVAVCRYNGKPGGCTNTMCTYAHPGRPK